MYKAQYQEKSVVLSGDGQCDLQANVPSSAHTSALLPSPLCNHPAIYQSIKITPLYTDLYKTSI